MSSLKDANRTLIALLGLIVILVGATLSVGMIWGDVIKNKSLAAEHQKKINSTSSDLEVEKEKVKQIEERQRQYNSAIIEISKNQAAQTATLNILTKAVERLAEKMDRVP